MPREVISAVGDDLDLICFREYGRDAGVTERVLEANPALSAIAIDLPPGTRIVLPDLDAQSLPQDAVRLWD